MPPRIRWLVLQDIGRRRKRETRRSVAAVLRELATDSFGRQFPRDYLTDLADQIEDF